MDIEEIVDKVKNKHYEDDADLRDDLANFVNIERFGAYDIGYTSGRDSVNFVADIESKNTILLLESFCEKNHIALPFSSNFDEGRAQVICSILQGYFEKG